MDHVDPNLTSRRPYPQDGRTPASRGHGDPDAGPIEGAPISDPEDARAASLKQYGGNRGIITTRPSRDTIVRSYSEQAATRARNARMASQKTYQDYQANSDRERERRMRREQLRVISDDGGAPDGVVPDGPATAHRSTQREHMGRAHRPLTSEESRMSAARSAERYERNRASRDALAGNRISRSPNRRLIDARGSVDSRAFSEYDQLVGYSVDESDRPQPFVDASNPKSKWRSHAGQGFDGTRDRSIGASMQGRPQAMNQGLNLNSLSDAISGKDAYGNPKNGIAGLPAFVKIAVPVIVVLIIILIVILFG